MLARPLMTFVAEAKARCASDRIDAEVEAEVEALLADPRALVADVAA